MTSAITLAAHLPRAASRYGSTGSHQIQRETDRRRTVSRRVQCPESLPAPGNASQSSAPSA